MQGNYTQKLQTISRQGQYREYVDNMLFNVIPGKRRIKYKCRVFHLAIFLTIDLLLTENINFSKKALKMLALSKNKHD